MTVPTLSGMSEPREFEYVLERQSDGGFLMTSWRDATGDRMEAHRLGPDLASQAPPSSAGTSRATT